MDTKSKRDREQRASGRTAGSKKSNPLRQGDLNEEDRPSTAGDESKQDQPLVVVQDAIDLEAARQGAGAPQRQPSPTHASQGPNPSDTEFQQQLRMMELQNAQLLILKDRESIEVERLALSLRKLEMEHGLAQFANGPRASASDTSIRSMSTKGGSSVTFSKLISSGGSKPIKTERPPSPDQDQYFKESLGEPDSESDDSTGYKSSGVSSGAESSSGGEWTTVSKRMKANSVKTTGEITDWKRFKFLALAPMHSLKVSTFVEDVRTKFIENSAWDQRTYEKRRKKRYEARDNEFYKILIDSAADTTGKGVENTFAKTARTSADSGIGLGDMALSCTFTWKTSSKMSRKLTRIISTGPVKHSERRKCLRDRRPLFGRSTCSNFGMIVVAAYWNLNTYNGTLQS